MAALPLQEDAFSSRRRATFRSPTLSTTSNIPPPPTLTPAPLTGSGGDAIVTSDDDEDLDLGRNDVVLPPTTGFGDQGSPGGFDESDISYADDLNALTPQIDLDLTDVHTIANNPLVSLLANVTPVTKALQLAIANLTSPSAGGDVGGVGGQAEGAESVGADDVGTSPSEANVSSESEVGAESVGADSDPGGVGDVGGVGGQAEGAESVGADDVGTSSSDAGDAAAGSEGGEGVGADDAGDAGGDGGGDGGAGAGDGGGSGGDGGDGGPGGEGAFARGGKVYRRTGFAKGGKVPGYSIGGVVNDIRAGRAGDQDQRAFSIGGQVQAPPPGAADPAGPDDQFVSGPSGMASIQEGEFIIPREVVDYLGEKTLRNLVSRARRDLGMDTEGQDGGAGASSSSGAQQGAIPVPQPPVTAPGAPLDDGGGEFTLQPASQPIGNPAIALNDPQAPQPARQPDSTGFTF